MNFRIVAFHYPKAEHHDEMVRRCGRAAEVMATSPGCLDVEVWKEESGGAVVTTGKFESKEACMYALRKAAAEADIQFDDRESRPREVHNLIEAIYARGQGREEQEHYGR